MYALTPKEVKTISGSGAPVYESPSPGDPLGGGFPLTPLTGPLTPGAGGSSPAASVPSAND